MTPLPETLHILLVEDTSQDALLMERQFKKANIAYVMDRIETRVDLEAALKNDKWDIVISDYALPSFSGLDVIELVTTRRPNLPIILVSGSVGDELAADTIRRGARDYVLKGNLTRLVPAVLREVEESRLRVKQEQLESELHASQNLIERYNRYFPRPVAEKLAVGANQNPFEWHRRDVTVLFIDLRGFTSFVETAEPEDVVKVLNEYYSCIGKATHSWGGTLGHVAGDGVMVFFNDPIEVEEPEQLATHMALVVREELKRLRESWRQEAEYEIDFGAGIASGHATIGGIGVEGCWDYTIVGTVTNIASRLCAMAKNGEILVPQRFANRIAPIVQLEDAGRRDIKGIHKSIKVFNVLNTLK